MNDNAIVVHDSATIMPSVPDSKTIESVWRLAQLAAASGMTKARKPEDAFFIAMYGLELGIPPMTALRTIYSISGGVPTCSGEALLSLMRKSPKVRVTVPNVGEITDSATITIERLDTSEKQSFTYTKAMASKAGLTNKQNWKQHLHMMLFWRVVSMGAKAMCSDIVGGLYTIEEIAPDSQVNEQGELVGEVIIDTIPTLNKGNLALTQQKNQDEPKQEIQKQRPEASIPEGATRNVRIETRETRAHKNGNFNLFTATTGERISIWTRELFKDSGWNTEGWDAVGGIEEMDFMATISMQKNGYWKFIKIPDFDPMYNDLGKGQPALLDNDEGDLGHYADDSE